MGRRLCWLLTGHHTSLRIPCSCYTSAATAVHHVLPVIVYPVINLYAAVCKQLPCSCVPWLHVSMLLLPTALCLRHGRNTPVRATLCSADLGVTQPANLPTCCAVLRWECHDKTEPCCAVLCCAQVKGNPKQWQARAAALKQEAAQQVGMQSFLRVSGRQARCSPVLGSNKWRWLLDSCASCSSVLSSAAPAGRNKMGAANIAPCSSCSYPKRPSEC